ncbi:MAG: pirin family protein [Planctomycetota bacterium]
MTFRLRPADERGHADHGWLFAKHSFSFADYHDPAHTGFRSLRVINEDRIAPSRGFSPHPHRDMEIFTYVIDGALEHKDSMGNGRVLRPGQVQVMSAGTGVVHSEFNPDPAHPTHLFQIWIRPAVTGVAPRYSEWQPSSTAADAPKILVISPDGRDGSASIHQDALVHLLRLEPGVTVEHESRPGRGQWLQMMTGALALSCGDEHAELRSGDAVAAESPGRYAVTAREKTLALWFDLGA